MSKCVTLHNGQYDFKINKALISKRERERERKREREKRRER